MRINGNGERQKASVLSASSYSYKVCAIYLTCPNQHRHFKLYVNILYAFLHYFPPLNFLLVIFIDVDTRSSNLFTGICYFIVRIYNTFFGSYSTDKGLFIPPNSCYFKQFLLFKKCMQDLK